MDEETKKRLRHIRDATEVNKRHADMLRTQSESRHERARVQIREELIDNRTIKYTSHMRWINK